MTELCPIPHPCFSTYSTAFVKMGPVNDSGTWREYDHPKKKNQLKVCARNGNGIFDEDEVISILPNCPLTGNAPGQLHSPLPAEELLSLKCVRSENTEPCPQEGLRRESRLTTNPKARLDPLFAFVQSFYFL